MTSKGGGDYSKNYIPGRGSVWRSQFDTRDSCIYFPPESITIPFSYSNEHGLNECEIANAEQRMKQKLHESEQLEF
jgi:hypothetical protein